ncbi:uncharacterized protein LOC124119670 [Haliotis rufescens]|uniref:uncharacterized protein LOC124119670 n=1 Tax=Haliotis rufescens TaxID=6454 RepID=UPI00201EE8FE|nr:uncharacterized protein LOC124119670 [Haliotis rufescens]
MHQQRHGFIHKAVTSHCVADMYDIYETVAVASRDKDTSEDKRPIPSTIVFTHDTDKLRRSVDEVQLGEVNTVGGLSDRTSSPVLMHEIDCRSGDMFYDLRDVVVLTVHGIKVITVIDYLHCQLSTCYVPNKTSFNTCLQLPSQPMRIAKVGGARAAVTLPDTQQIAFINFDPEPTLHSTVRTRRKYGGLAFLNPSQLLAGGYDGRASVDVLDMKGNILKSISTGVIRNPHEIHVSGENKLVVSEATVKSIVSVTSEGKTVFTYTPTGDRALTCPQGITTIRTGDILPVDRDTHRLIQLTKSGQFVRDVLTQKDGMHYPHSICLDDDSVLYVNNSRYVRVYGFEKH